MFIYLFEGPAASGKTLTAETFFEGELKRVVHADGGERINFPMEGNVIVESLTSYNYEAIIKFLKLRDKSDFTKIVITTQEMGLAEKLSRDLGGFVVINMQFRYVFVPCQ